MSDTVTWLHLSDLHLRCADEWDSKPVLEKLSEDLRDLEADTGIPDLVFFTGDLVFGNTPEQTIEQQFAQAGAFLDQIRKAFSVEIPKERLFIVPGNHDVDRRQITPAETEWLRSTARSELEIIRELKGNTVQCRRWMERLWAYRKFLKDYGLTHLTPDDPHLIWTHSLEIGQKKVGIAGFNSAWSCASSDEKAKLWLGGRWQVAELQKRLGEVDFSIAAIHHPSNWLRDEDPVFGRKLRDKFNLVIHGHEHLEAVEQNEDGNILVSAGACYQCGWMPNGYNVGKVKINGTEGEIFLRTWDNVGDGWVAKNIAKRAPSGVWPLKEILAITSPDRDAPKERSGRQNAPILNLTTAATEEALQKRMQSIRKSPLHFQIQHSRVRLTERARIELLLSEDRLAWLAADWQMGKDGFISATLNALGSSDALSNIYRVDCGQAVSVDEVFNEAGTQLGIAFVEFAELIRQADQPTLILEDIPANILTSPASFQNLTSKLAEVIKFSSNIRIICIARHWPSTNGNQSLVKLVPLDIPEVISYIKSHPHGGALAARVNLIERIHARTGGLPVAIDRLIEQCQLVSVDTVLEELEEAAESDLEAVPQSLKDAVSRVFNPRNDHEHRSLLLLKLLTVLKDGETFESIRRFYHRTPFNVTNIVELAKLGLIESIEIAQTGNDLLPRRSIAGSFAEPPKLLRVQRQVRDYVSTLITQDERTKIFHAASEALFGGKWYEGTVSLRRSIITAYRQSSIAGPGNELLVAQYLLQTAIATGRNDRIERFAKLAAAYCSELKSKDRFRDATIAAGVVVKILETRKDKNWLTCAYVFGHSLRMTGQYEEALKIFRDILDNGHVDSNEFRGEILLEIAWCHEALHEKALAILHANKAIGITQKDSDTWIQAHALLAEYNLTGPQLIEELERLADTAYRNKIQMAGDNISLSLAKLSKDKKVSLKHLDRVLASAKDMYNRSRAISSKATQLRKSGRISELTVDEQSALCIAYEYSYGQRINNILDSCHDSLWEFCRFKNIWVALFRLYRYTSFVWVMTDRTKPDKSYVDVLMDIRKSEDYKPEYVEVEVSYLDSRIAPQSSELALGLPGTLPLGPS